MQQAGDDDEDGDESPTDGDGSREGGEAANGARVDGGGDDEDSQAREPPFFLPCPNNRQQTGDDRNNLIVNPGFNKPHHLMQCRIFGQLCGIAIRSKCCLDIDLAEATWKALLGEELVPNDLKSFDFTAWQSLQFTDPSTGIQVCGRFLSLVRLSVYLNG